MFIYLLFIILFIKCDVVGEHQGVVRVQQSMMNVDSLGSSSTLEMGYRILFRDEKSIQEVPLLEMVSDSSGTKSIVKIKHYSYLDPDNNVCYNYRNFSDTATVLNYFSNIDSVNIDGGWNFYSASPFEYDSAKNITDTVVNDVSFGRIRLDKKINNNEIYFQLYYRCDKKQSLIKIFKHISDSIGCPIFKVETYYKNKLFSKREIEYISGTLSQNEQKVFDAWEKNIKLYPVNKK